MPNETQFLQFVTERPGVPVCDLFEANCLARALQGRHTKERTGLRMWCHSIAMSNQMTTPGVSNPFSKLLEVGSRYKQLSLSSKRQLWKVFVTLAMFFLMHQTKMNITSKRQSNAVCCNVCLGGGR